MVEVLTAAGQVVARVEAGKGAEIADEMRLVEITAGGSEVGPVHVAAGLDEA